MKHCYIGKVKAEMPPVIRFYGWDPATLSIGYFQKARKEINLEAVKSTD